MRVDVAVKIATHEAAGLGIVHDSTWIRARHLELLAENKPTPFVSKPIPRAKGHVDSCWDQVERSVEEHPFCAVNLSPPFMRTKRKFRMAKIIDNRENGGRPIMQERVRDSVTDPVKDFEEKAGRIVRRAGKARRKREAMDNAMLRRVW